MSEQQIMFEGKIYTIEQLEQVAIQHPEKFGLFRVKNIEKIE